MEVKRQRRWRIGNFAGLTRMALAEAGSARCCPRTLPGTSRSRSGRPPARTRAPAQLGCCTGQEKRRPRRKRAHWHSPIWQIGYRGPRTRSLGAARYRGRTPLGTPAALALATTPRPMYRGQAPSPASKIGSVCRRPQWRCCRLCTARHSGGRRPPPGPAPLRRTGTCRCCGHGCGPPR